ncbi:MAG: endoribonuclease MazF [Spirochaetes bacterium]|nr:endoribonuclease MazF [Spirochaetota bacterium]
MVKSKSYIPGRGDIVWLDFTPQSGHEQRGRRPAVVISPKSYNSKTNLALFCPITSKVKGYPFEVSVQSKSKINGVILSDQIKNLDWNARSAELIDCLDEETMDELIAKIRTLID